MSKQPIQHVVEFWPAAAGHGAAPLTVECGSEAAASTLETQFHSVGWAARAVTLTLQRTFPTAYNPGPKQAA